MLNPTTLPPGYAYFYGTNVVPGSFQYSAPLYPVGVHDFGEAIVIVEISG
jgi:hypothetical protein